MDNFKMMRDLVAAKRAVLAAHGVEHKVVKPDYKKSMGSEDYAVARDLSYHLYDGKASAHFVVSDKDKAINEKNEGLSNY